ncbi:MAG: rRNA maturation RNase YbeY [Oscillospiraceae bacterium]|jgi:probable rRNA maturation factor|nr:rRNA maturation RNase YbeY [Oscillospiraceae bacterium]
MRKMRVNIAIRPELDLSANALWPHTSAALRRRRIAKLVRLCAQAAAESEGAQAVREVNILVTDDVEMILLNSTFRALDKPTDVLSFPSGDEVSLGDIAISYQRASDQAEKYGHSLYRELGYLAVHAMLHLFGYDHEDGWQKAEMREREECILASVGLIR